MNKIDLRRHYRAVRKAYVAGLTAEQRVQLQRQLASTAAPALADVAMMASYAAVGDEIDPACIDDASDVLAFPCVTGPDILFHGAERHSLRPGYQLIPEPPTDAAIVGPNVLLVPLLAVTLAGVRLGQGRGYYDRALAALRSKQPVLAIGIAWDCQIAPALPTDAWDMPLDMIATPSRLVDCRKWR
ncbi:5-formyltetrahydrofolate cyclo-ligase [Sandarakinorhabdus sp.]|uniref:5-formyltetrahydrofolate cyclo-ligase n=1 Tax=Sandarakinorhabdus sp. TaxID=1916663 RepID=UPI00356756D3